MAHAMINGESMAEPLEVAIASVAELPSQFGEFRIFVFSNNRDGKEHVAMVHVYWFPVNRTAVGLN